MSKKIEVVVAKRRSIYLNGDQIPGAPKGAPGQSFGPGSKIMVDESDVERLFYQGFIVDPLAAAISAADAESADLSAYVPDLAITEKSDQSIKQARA